MLAPVSRSAVTGTEARAAGVLRLRYPKRGFGRLMTQTTSNAFERAVDARAADAWAADAWAADAWAADAPGAGGVEVECWEGSATDACGGEGAGAEGGSTNAATYPPSLGDGGVAHNDGASEGAKLAGKITVGSTAGATDSTSGWTEVRGESAGNEGGRI